jgi:hypothetical protein
VEAGSELIVLHSYESLTESDASNQRGPTQNTDATLSARLS